MVRPKRSVHEVREHFSPTSNAAIGQKMALRKPILAGFKEEDALLRIHIHPKILQVVKSQ
jgi:hypothetical protein